MTALEKMARAARKAYFAKMPGSPHAEWDAAPDFVIEMWTETARAALLAIREPSEGMLKAAGRKSYQLRHGDTDPGAGEQSDDALIFTATIDHILNGGE